MPGPFNQDQQARFDREMEALLKRYPPDRKQAAMIPALRLCQDMLGYLPPEAMDLVARRLGVPPPAAEEVATFYTMLHPVAHGRHLLDVCTNVSCSLRGAEKVLAYLEQKLGVKAGGTTSDKRVTLREAECLASCGTAPVIMVDEKYYAENLTPRKLDELLGKLD